MIETFFVQLIPRIISAGPVYKMEYPDYLKFNVKCDEITGHYQTTDSYNGFQDQRRLCKVQGMEKDVVSLVMAYPDMLRLLPVEQAGLLGKELQPARKIEAEAEDLRVGRQVSVNEFDIKVWL